MVLEVVVLGQDALGDDVLKVHHDGRDGWCLGRICQPSQLGGLLVILDGKGARIGNQTVLIKELGSLM